MPLTAFLARTAYMPGHLDNAVVVIEDDRIVAAGSRDEIEVPAGARQVKIEGGCLAPGFIDIHNHGAGGRDVMEATPEALATVGRTLARFGTTSYYPTTLTAPREHIEQAVAFLADHIAAAGRQHGPTAEPLGIHMEGPYLSVKRRGVHPAEHIVEPTLETYRAIASAAKGQLRIVTIAPELKHAPDLIREMINTGVRPSMGHTDATFAQADQAAQLGVRQATHMFNAMRPFGHRDPGVIGKVLTDARIQAELIADGVHVDPHAIELLYRAKGAGGIVLITDGLSAVGMPDGKYVVGGLEVEVAGGVCRHQGTLAGSVLTLDRAVRNMRDFVSLPVAEAIGMATWNPARLMGVDDRKGRLQAGCDADLVILDDELKVRRVWTRGQPV
jgi:N-acetylglucosamine-6-phosphate deacetylase